MNDNRYRRGGLGRGLGALIPTGPHRDADVSETADTAAVGAAGPETAGEPHTEAPWSAGSDAAAEGDRPETEAPEDGPTSSETDAAQLDAAEFDAVQFETVQPDTDALSTSPATQPDEDTTVPEMRSPLTPVAGAEYAELPIERISANPRQPRQVFDDESLDELVHSVREFGVLQPVVVRPAGEHFELVMGERRLRAAAAAGLTRIPAIVRTTADDAMLRDALLENIHRVQLNPLEEAAAYQQLLQEFDTTHDQLASRLGRSRPQISNTIRLLQLPVAVQRRVAAGILSAGHARALLGLDDPDAQEELASRIVAEGLSVRATEELVALHVAGHAAAGGSKRRRSAARVAAPAVSELADRLSDVFDTKVRVDIGRRKGKITVEFASVDDLERIVAVMAPQVAARGEAPAAADGTSESVTSA
jgi:ParB family chromosome partitioning protein